MNKEKMKNLVGGGSGNSKYLVIAGVLSVVVLAGALVYQNFLAVEPEVAVVEETPVVQPEGTEGLEIPVDWKTYRNEEYGFEFGYPTGGEAPSEHLRGAIFVLFLKEVKSNIFLEYYPPNSKVTFNNFLEGPWGHSLEDIPEEIIIDTKKAMKFSYTTLRTGKGEYDPNHNEQVGLQDKVGGFFVINFGIALEEKEYGISLFNEILSTFRFLD